MMDIGRAKLGMIVADNIAQKEEDDQDDENNRADQGQLYVMHRFPNRLCAVEEHL